MSRAFPRNRCCAECRTLRMTPTHSLLVPDRKLKKLLRELKNKNPAVAEKEEERPPQQWNLDYALAPFEGLTPEYMEMSEYAHIQYTHTHAYTQKVITEPEDNKIVWNFGWNSPLHCL